MFAFSKLFDPEWYFRKYFIVVKRFLSSKRVSEIQLIHQVKDCYKYTFHKKLHLHHPKSLNEKLLWLSLYWRHPLKAECADKVKVRDYVVHTKKLDEQLLVPLIGIYDNTEEIPFESLPNQFVLKCNHGCGYNIIVDDKSKADFEGICKQLQVWMSETYGGALTEFHYRDIIPHRILCELYLPSLGDKGLIDYKIHCINGRPSFVLVCYDRDEHEVAKLATFSLQWEQLYYCVDEQPLNIDCPSSLCQMIDLSCVLASDFPFVRIDFYDDNGKPLIGELTFTPYGNMIDYYKQDVLDDLGRHLVLPPKYKQK